MEVQGLINMMKPPTNRMDLTNQKYNKITALNYHETDKHGNSVWKCLCDCGEYSYVRLGALRAGQIKQCMKCNAKDKTKYNIQTLRLRSIYRDMLRRCYNSERDDYHRYGGREIKICDEWLESPESFERWSLENDYSEELSIDRIDNDGNYHPDNCRWTDDKTQANNRSNSHMLEYKGVKLTVTQWAEKLGVHPHTLYNRIRNNEDEDSIFNTKDIRQQKSKSGVNGISWYKARKMWHVRVLEDSVRVSVGYYYSLDNAIYAKDEYITSSIRLSEEEIKRQINNN